ncbi:MAG: UDP-N-acetylmuramoyl-L-alanyl-D-glutamate--2,6-diaminopimelate ligase [Pseudomonadota bacterium]|nr:UDP-N-acetylmuramoyl-L-alanyl-D-glutamate--2,6-diaminopimelate ligase [Pseudomonadota bacterium]
MHLSKLIEKETTKLRQGWTDVEISGLSADSRNIRPGNLFAAIPGAAIDGRRFIDEAIAKGASAILAPPNTHLDASHKKIPLVIEANPRRALAKISARFFNTQPKTTVAITGTNGKTSVAHITQQLWNNLGKKAASLGTLGVVGSCNLNLSKLTTPDPVELHRLLHKLASKRINHLALEASSHGLSQYRLDGVVIQAAVFTNFSRDHLDYHKTMAAYLNAKLRLFHELVCDGGTAIAYSGAPEAAIIESIAKRKRQNYISYGSVSADISVVEKYQTNEGWSANIQAFGKTYPVMLGFAGGFQIQNLLAAIALVHSTGTPLENIIPKIETLTGVPGRMQRAGKSIAGGTVYIDYAHTPDALKNALFALRPLIANKLILIFGCGGDRDIGKRTKMGAIACQFADRVIVTDDNPRTEDAAAIRRSILKGCASACEISDRREAIENTIAQLECGDGLLIAGKGHETGQIMGNEVLPFNDLEIAKAALGGAT